MAFGAGGAIGIGQERATGGKSYKGVSSPVIAERTRGPGGANTCFF